MVKKINARDMYGNVLLRLVQYDRDIYVYILDDVITEACPVHFSSYGSTEALVVSDTSYENGILSAKIPNILLEQDKMITGWVYIELDRGERTAVFFNIDVINRPMPTDWIPPESDDYVSLTHFKEDLIAEFKKVVDENKDNIGEIVDEYLIKNPIEEKDPTVPSWAKQPTKPVYTAEEVGALPKDTEIPPDLSDEVAGKQDKISDLEQIRRGASLGMTALQSFTESDPTVPAWAKQPNKPTYSAQEVGAMPDNTFIPTRTSDLENDSDFVTQGYVDSSVGTNTAYYISNDGQPFTSLDDLRAYSGNLTNNDYAFVIGTDSLGNVTYTRYKYNAESEEWAEEYVLNNSSFTSEQWDAITSGITSTILENIQGDIDQLRADVNGKQEAGDYALVSDIPTKTSELTNDSGYITEADIPGQKVLNVKKIEDYLYNINPDTLDYDYAYNYFLLKKPDIGIGACSSVRNGNFYGRNFDWQYNDNVEFVVQTIAKDGFHGTIGVAGQLSKLTRTFVESGVYDDVYKILPFMLTDGINDAGVVCNLNVVPADNGETTGTIPTEMQEAEVCNLMLPRFILDRFSTAHDAVEYIQKHVSVYTSKSISDMGYEIHLMVGDNSSTYVIEFIENEIKVIDVKAYPYMTNFHLFGITRNADGSVYTPSTQDASHNAISTNGITENGSGLERYNLIKAEFDSADTYEGMRNLMEKLNYTNAYKRSTEPFWYTEFVGSGRTVASPVSDFSAIVNTAIEHYETRQRNDLLTWQTNHSAVYDIEKRTLTLRVQEQDTEYKYGFGYYSKDEVDNKLTGKTEKRILEYTGSQILNANGKVLNFRDIYDMLMESPDFVVVVYGNRVYHPSYIAFNDGAASYFYFNATMIDGGATRTNRLYIHSSDSVEIDIVSTTPVTNENASNKISSITDDDKESTTKYTSPKAVVDYVDPKFNSLKNDMDNYLTAIPGDEVEVPTIGEFNALKDDLTTKVGYSEVVGNQLIMYADSTKAKLLATLDLPTTDLTNYIKNTDYASSSERGVVKYSNQYGVDDAYPWTGDPKLKGVPFIVRAQDSDIKSRVSRYRPIVPANIVPAVDSVLCSTAENEQLTAEKQTAARRRLGLDKEWVLIEEITLAEETKRIERISEPDGTPYSFERVMIFFEVKKASVVSQIALNLVHRNGHYVDLYVNGGINTSDGYFYVKSEVDKCENGYIVELLSTSPSTQANTVTANRRNSPKVVDGECYKIIIAANSQDAAFTTGTVIKIYAIRA